MDGRFPCVSQFQEGWQLRLTLKSAAALKLPDGKSDHIEFDDAVAGFGLRLRAGGSRTWIYQYRVGSRQRRMVLGSAKSVPLVLARENASKLEAKIKLGGDPAMEKAVARRAANDTFGVLAEQYFDAHKSRWRPRSEDGVRRHLTLYAKPLHRLPIASISQRDVAHLLSTLAKSVGDVTSNRVRASLAAFFAWAIREGISMPAGNVATHTNKREERSRERVLSDAELTAIWAACRDDDYGKILKLIALTGQRGGEIAGLRWDEVHDDQIILPAERTKNHRTHVVPLSEAARAILGTVNARSRAHVFGRDDTGFKGWDKAKEALDVRIAAESPIPHWTPHDLRRTVATRMADLGVQPHVIEAVLNHASGHKSGVAGIYNRATYDKEKREALNLWATHLLAVVEGSPSKIVALRGRP
jgi:integrase